MACNRRIFLRLIGAASLAGGAWAGRTARGAQPSDPGAAAGYEVSHSDAEWRKLLTDAQYRVLREEGTETPVQQPAERRASRRHVRVRRLRAAAVFIEDQVRQRHRLAEFLAAAAITRSSRIPTSRSA